jgi:hypothetical protein
MSEEGWVRLVRLLALAVKLGVGSNGCTGALSFLPGEVIVLVLIILRGTACELLACELLRFSLSSCGWFISPVRDIGLILSLG